MPHFKAKMHQIRFRAPADPIGGAYSTPQDPTSDLGPTSKERGGEARTGGKDKKPSCR